MFGAIDMYVLDKKSRQAGCQLKKRSACRASEKNQLVHQIGLIKEGGILKEVYSPFMSASIMY